MFTSTVTVEKTLAHVLFLWTLLTEYEKMKRTPCEYIIWHKLPIIRKEIALRMINNYGLSQKETAEKLGISYAAISQYLSGKRGNIIVTDKQLTKEINLSAKRIIQLGDNALVSETCRLCKIFGSKKLLEKSGKK